MNQDTKNKLAALMAEQLNKATKVTEQAKSRFIQPKVETEPQPKPVKQEQAYQEQEIEAVNIFDLLKDEKTEAPIFLAPETTEAEPAQEIEPVKADVRILQYTDKAIVLQGEGTRQFKELFKEIGGIYRTNWKCGAGWMFSNRHREFLEDIIG